MYGAYILYREKERERERVVEGSEVFDSSYTCTYIHTLHVHVHTFSVVAPAYMEAVE